ncbi:putative quinol monooxygenase [Halobacteriovorax sp. RZ-2]|uniref:putative quinol monooxygenase n=1 Tax=unclassified Halobacteriovorax TaxID=2639665 RepID=UPI00371DB033
MLVLIVNIKAKSDKTELIKTELLKLVEETYKEVGCTKFDPHQEEEDPSSFWLYEIWETEAHWKAHMETEHVKHFLAYFDENVEKFDVRRAEKLI